MILLKIAAPLATNGQPVPAAGAAWAAPALDTARPDGEREIR
jgi:hypothetical protein